MDVNQVLDGSQEPKVLDLELKPSPSAWKKLPSIFSHKNNHDKDLGTVLL